MRDLIDRLQLIENLQAGVQPDFHFMVLEDGDIFIMEGDAEIQAVVDAIRSLAKTGEGRQVSQNIFGKEPDDVSDEEIFDKLIAPGYQKLKPFTGMMKQGLDAIPGGYKPSDVAKHGTNPIYGYYLRDKIAKQIPKTTVDTGPSGVGTVNVDTSNDDIKRVLKAYNSLGDKFPKAKDMLDQKDVAGALRQIYSRMKAD
jgi:hypothetical protein